MTDSTNAPHPGQVRSRPQPAATGVRRAGQVTVPPLLMLFLGLGVVQIFLAGLGVFALEGEELGTPDETAFDPHRMVGLVMTVVTLLIMIAAALARPGRQVVIMAVVLFLLVAVLQSVLAQAGEDTAFFGGLHALFGIGSLGLASRLLVLTRV